MAKYGSLPCEITGLRTDYITGKLEMTIGIPKGHTLNARIIAEKTKGKKLSMEVADEKKKRSLDANAYMWTLCTKIADKLNIPKEEVYRENIKELSDNFYLQLMRNDTIKPFSEIWKANGIGWIVEKVDESPQHPGYSWVNVYYGSSLYDTKQMSRLIDNVIQDAAELGIETLTPQELDRMKAAW